MTTTAMPALERAACRASGFDPLTATETELDAAAKQHCARCWNRPECLVWGLEHEDSGLWGGHTSSGLRALRKEFGIALSELHAAAYINTSRPRKATTA